MTSDNTIPILPKAELRRRSLAYHNDGKAYLSLPSLVGLSVVSTCFKTFNHAQHSPEGPTTAVSDSMSEVSTPFVTRICNLDMMCERCMHTVSYSPVIFNVSLPYGQAKLISPLFYGFRLFCAHFPYFLSLLVPLRLEHTFYRTLPHVFLDAPSIYPPGFRRPCLLWSHYVYLITVTLQQANRISLYSYLLPSPVVTCIFLFPPLSYLESFTPRRQLTVLTTFPTPQSSLNSPLSCTHYVQKPESGPTCI